MNTNWTIGKYIWAKWGSVYWPGVVVGKDDAQVYVDTSDRVVVFWFGDHRVSQVNPNCLKSFAENFGICYNEKTEKGISKTRLSGIYEAIKQYGQPTTNEMSNEELIELALNDFLGCVPNESELSEQIKIEMQHKKLKKFTANNVTKNIATLKRAIERGEHDKTVCLACYTHKVSDIEHPLFQGKLCELCSERLKSTYFVLEKDKEKYCQYPKHKYCIVCGDSCNSMIYCNSTKCNGKYCTQCVKHFEIDKECLTNPRWLCILCEYDQLNSILQPQDNRHYRLQAFLSNFDRCNPVMKIPHLRKLTTAFYGQSLVLQTFLANFKNNNNSSPDALDHIGTVMDISNIAAFPFENKRIYFVDIESGQMRSSNAMDTSNTDIFEFGNNIDLLLGGTSKNNVDIQSLGADDTLMLLFHQFFRLQQWYLCFQQGTHFYWVFEVGCTVTNMQRITISSLLNCQPTLCHVEGNTEDDSRNYLMWSNLLKE